MLYAMSVADLLPRDRKLEPYDGKENNWDHLVSSLIQRLYNRYRARLKAFILSNGVHLPFTRLKILRKMIKMQCYDQNYEELELNICGDHAMRLKSILASIEIYLMRNTLEVRGI